MSVHAKWLDDCWLSERWVKGKFRCTKQTPKCAVYPWADRRAGRNKCTPCKYLEVEHPDGTISTFNGDETITRHPAFMPTVTPEQRPEEDE